MKNHIIYEYFHFLRCSTIKFDLGLVTQKIQILGGEPDPRTGPFLELDAPLRQARAEARARARFLEGQRSRGYSLDSSCPRRGFHKCHSQYPTKILLFFSVAFRSTSRSDPVRNWKKSEIFATLEPERRHPTSTNVQPLSQRRNYHARCTISMCGDSHHSAHFSSAIKSWGHRPWTFCGCSQHH